MQKRSTTPWITRGIKKSSKHKILKKTNRKNELEYKNYKNFESMKKCAKKKINLKKPGMLLHKQEEKRDVITKTFV